MYSLLDWSEEDHTAWRLGMLDIVLSNVEFWELGEDNLEETGHFKDSRVTQIYVLVMTG
jgi:hypothetical protein